MCRDWLAGEAKSIPEEAAPKAAEAPRPVARRSSSAPAMKVPAAEPCMWCGSKRHASADCGQKPADVDMVVRATRKHGHPSKRRPASGRKRA